ncbi:MAG: class I SAM-dependent methyltransferase [Bacteroidota bacterium]
MNKTQQVKEGFDKYATAYQDRHMEESLYNETFDVFCDVIKKQNAGILELGCGPGNITQYLLKKRPDFKLLGLDLAPVMIELAKVNNPTAEFEVMDCREINSLNKTFDGIMCGFCLPYISKEETIQLINDSYNLLNPEGVIYISTMEDDYSKSGWKSSSDGKHQMFMHYHQEDYIAAALTENGFKIVELRRQDYPTTDGSKVIDLIIIAQK